MTSHHKEDADLEIGLRNKNDVMLSVLVPVFNERDHIEEILDRVQKVPIKKEIIIVDDGSTDGTGEILHRLKTVENIKIIFHEHNQGKGAAIRSATSHVKGELVIIQDADLEYNPHDYLKLIEPILDEKCDVVYGSRCLKRTNKNSYLRYYWGGKIVTLFANLLYEQKLTDEPTCYKLFRTKLFKSIHLDANGFEFCAEITAKIAKRKIKIIEVPIDYHPRSMEDGKKIRWHDGLSALWTLLKYRFTD